MAAGNVKILVRQDYFSIEGRGRATGSLFISGVDQQQGIRDDQTLIYVLVGVGVVVIVVLGLAIFIGLKVDMRK